MRALLTLALVVLLPAVSLAQLTATLDKSEYVQGEVVEITLHNGTTEPVQLVSAPWYCVERTDGDYPTCTGLPTVYDLEPGETFVGHHDTGLLPDPVGEYAVGVIAPGVDPLPYRLSAPVESQRQDWSTLKSMFR